MTLAAGVMLVATGGIAVAAPPDGGGNNGTVKIDGWTLDHGSGNGAPNRNEPHVGCTFDIEWYNYDAGVTSTVTFAMQAPTAGVALSGTAPSQVQLDDDDASGANADGLDAVQRYTLSFDGPAHPQHGYHVKLTVNTPISKGADVKHKVFWVEGCDDKPDKIPVPPKPEVHDPCGEHNAKWIVPKDTDLLDWMLSDDGVLSVKIKVEGVVFEDGQTTHSYGKAPEYNKEPCPPRKIPIPREPKVDDPCGEGNATWKVPHDTDLLKWTVDNDGVLTVTIKVDGVVFKETGKTYHSYGKAPEHNKEPCPPRKIPIPPEPGVDDPCDAGNATWQLPDETEMFKWMISDGDLIVMIKVEGVVFKENGKNYYNYGKAPEKNTEPCPPGTVPVPAEPQFLDPCNPAGVENNAEWIVPENTDVLMWSLDEATGVLTVKIIPDDTVFEGTDQTMLDFGVAPESGEECEVLGEEAELPARPGVRDPCGSGNARWIVPKDTEELDWTLEDGVLSVEILVPDTVFKENGETTFSFGTAPETNTRACDVKGEEKEKKPDVEVRGAQAVPTAVDAGLASGSEQARRTSLGLVAIGVGLLLMGASFGGRRRTAARR